MSYSGPPLDTGVIAAMMPLPGAAVWMTANDAARRARYREYLRFDAGKHDVGRLGIGATAVVVNYAAAFVRKGASYLMPEPVRYRVAPPDAGDAAVAAAVRCERLLAAVSRTDDLDLVDLATAIDAAVLGDAAYKVTYDANERRVRVVAVDPQSLYVETAPDNPRGVVTVRQYGEHRAGGAGGGGRRVCAGRMDGDHLPPHGERPRGVAGGEPVRLHPLCDLPELAAPA